MPTAPTRRELTLRLAPDLGNTTWKLAVTVALAQPPQRALCQWFRRRFACGGGRIRRIGIVALARKLLIAPWRYVDAGVMPDGALLKA